MFDTNINVLGSLTDIVIDDIGKHKGGSLSQSGRYNRTNDMVATDQTQSLMF